MKNPLTSIALALTIYAAATTYASADRYASGRQALIDSAAQAQLISDPTSAAGDKPTVSTQNGDSLLRHESPKAYGGR